MKYLKSFKNHDRYHSFLDSDEFVKPNVSFIESDESMRYHRFMGPFIPPTPPEEEDTEPMIRATFMASEANMLGLTHTTNIKKLKVDGEEVPIEYVNYVSGETTITKQNVVVPENGDYDSMYLTGVAGFMSSGVLSSIGFSTKASHDPKDKVNALIFFFDGKIKSDNEGTYQEDPMALAMPIEDVYFIQGALNGGNGSFFTYNPDTCTATLDMYMIIMTFLMFTGDWTGICYAYVDYDSEDVIIVDTTTHFKALPDVQVEPYIFTSSGEHTMEITLGDSTIPMLLFTSTCIKDAIVNKYVNEIHMGAFAASYSLRSLTFDGTCDFNEMSLTQCPNLKNLKLKEGARYLNSMAFMGTSISEVDLSKTHLLSMATLAGMPFLNSHLSLDSMTMLTPNNMDGMLGENSSRITSLHIGENCKLIGPSALTKDIKCISSSAPTEPRLYDVDVFEYYGDNIILQLPNAKTLDEYYEHVDNLYHRWLYMHPFIVEAPGLPLPTNLELNGYDIVAVYQSNYSAITLCNYLSSVTEMKIEETVLETPVSAYTFDSAYVYYTVRFKFADNEIPSDFFKNTRLVKLVIGDNITTIRKSAFGNCYGLRELIIPDTVLVLGENLVPSTNLTGITIGSGVYNMDISAFQSPFLKSIAINSDNQYYKATNNCIIDKQANAVIAAGYKSTIPSNTSIIAINAYSYVELADNSKLPSTLTDIGDKAFCFSKNLKTAIIPDSTTYIGNSAFSYCYDLETVVLGSSVTSLGIAAFDNCVSLESVTLSNTLSGLPKNAFSNCTSLTGITIPSNITVIGDYCFNNDILLENLTIEEGCTTIGCASFKECSYLRKLSIPSTVTSIGVSAFTNCSLNEIIVAPENTVYESEGHALVEKATKKMILGTTSFIVPDGVATIGMGSFPESNSTFFVGAVTKDEITIPASVTLIEKGAFGKTIKTIRCLGKTAPTLNIGSSDLASEGTVYYPYGSTGYDTWQSSLTGWTFIQVNE